MTVFFGFELPFYTNRSLTIGNGAAPCTIEDKRKRKLRIVRTYADYCASVIREPPEWAKDCPLVWAKTVTLTDGVAGLDLIEAEAENDGIITFVISSQGHYARSGGGGINGQISILRRYVVPSHDFGNAGKELESVNHTNIVCTGYALSSSGQAVASKNAVIRVKRDTDTVIRVTRSGYPARFGRGAKSQVWFLVVTGGEFYAVPEDEISAFFGGELPWKTQGREEFYIV